MKSPVPNSSSPANGLLEKARRWKAETRQSTSPDMLWQNRTFELARDVLALVGRVEAAERREAIYRDAVERIASGDFIRKDAYVIAREALERIPPWGAA